MLSPDSSFRSLSCAQTISHQKPPGGKSENKNSAIHYEERERQREEFVASVIPFKYSAFSPFPNRISN